MKLNREGWKKVSTQHTYQAKCSECGEWTERTVTDVLQLPKQPFCDQTCELAYREREKSG